MFSYIRSCGQALISDRSFVDGVGAAILQEESPFAQQRAEWRAQALANFPFEIVETSGENAFAKWKELKATGRGAPVVVGTDVANVLEPFQPRWQRRPVAEWVSAAEKIKFPEDLINTRVAERAEALAAPHVFHPAVPAYRLEGEDEPPLGEWPRAFPQGVHRAPADHRFHHHPRTPALGQLECLPCTSISRRRVTPLARRLWRGACGPGPRHD
jgi:hypothetical protein